MIYRMKLLKSKPLLALFGIVGVMLLAFILFIVTMSLSDYTPGEMETLEIDGKGSPVPPDKRVFSIMTWNLGYMGLGKDMDFFYDGGKMVRPGKDEYQSYALGTIGHLASGDQPDFILFQEVDRHSKRSYRNDQYGQLSSALPDHSSAFAVNYDVGYVPVPLLKPMGKVLSGIALFARYQPAECYRGLLPGEYSWPVRLFMLDRCFIVARYPLASGSNLVIINTHNEAFDAGEMRNKQMEHLREIMMEEYEKGHYVIAGGDWNMNPPGYSTSTFRNGDVARTILPELQSDFFPEDWKWVFDPTIPTNRDVIRNYERGKTLTTIIDFFVISPNIRVESARTTDLMFKWSDHQPFMMTFILEE